MLHEEQERGGEAVGAQFEEQCSGIDSAEQALVVMQEVLPQFLPAYRSLIEQTREELDAIEPPPEVQELHGDLIAAYRELVALVDESLDQVERGVAGEEVLQNFLGDRVGTGLGMRFTAITNALVAVAEDADISVDLSTGALIADTRSATPGGGVVISGGGPGISMAEALASDLDGPLLVNGFIVIREREARLSELPLESFSAQCGGASLMVDGYNPASGRGLNEEGGVSWSGGPVQVLGTMVGDHLVVSTLSR